MSAERRVGARLSSGASRRWRPGHSQCTIGSTACLCSTHLGMNVRSCRRQGLPDCHGAGASVRRCMPDGSVIRTAKLIVGPTAEGERWELRPGRSGCRRCLDLDPGPQMDTSPGSSSGPEPGSPCPGMPRRNRLPQPRPRGRRPMRPPGSPIFLFRYHAERRGRAEENARGPAVLHWNGPFGLTRWR